MLLPIQYLPKNVFVTSMTSRMFPCNEYYLSCVHKSEVLHSTFVILSSNDRDLMSRCVHSEITTTDALP